jgi:hypothetical protein
MISSQTATIPVIVLTAATRTTDWCVTDAAGCTVQPRHSGLPHHLFRTVQVTIARGKALQARARLAGERARRLVTPGQAPNRLNRRSVSHYRSEFPH